MRIFFSLSRDLWKGFIKDEWARVPKNGASACTMWSTHKHSPTKVTDFVGRVQCGRTWSDCFTWQETRAKRKSLPHLWIDSSCRCDLSQLHSLIIWGKRLLERVISAEWKREIPPGAVGLSSSDIDEQLEAQLRVRTSYLATAPSSWWWNWVKTRCWTW